MAATIAEDDTPPQAAPAWRFSKASLFRKLREHLKCKSVYSFIIIIIIVFYIDYLSYYLKLII